MRWLAPVIFAVVHIVIVTLAWRIRRGATWMLSGYAADRVVNEAGLARWAGTGLLLIGVVGIVAACMLAFVAFSRVVIVGYGSVVVTSLVILARGTRRFLVSAERHAG